MDCLGKSRIENSTTPERWKDLRRKHGIATSWGVEAGLLSPGECVEKSPLLEAGEILGGLYVPSDGLAKGVRVSEAMAREAGLLPGTAAAAAGADA